MKKIFFLLTFMFAACNTPTSPPEGRRTQLTPPAENLSLEIITRTDTTTSIFATVVNGKYAGTEPKLFVFIKHGENSDIGQWWWTHLYKKAFWEDGTLRLKDTLKAIGAYDTVYTGLNFPIPVTPDHITHYYIEVTM